ncbi:hypothetical protein BH24ACT5_BH24ACT5_29500 [soil metagenome]
MSCACRFLLTWLTHPEGRTAEGSSAVASDREGGERVTSGQDERIARLIHLNGAPGVGKSTLAGRYLDDHPLTLLIDIDGLRTSLGRWSECEESKVAARELALAMAERHLLAGHDVVVPQFLDRLEFIETMAAVAAQCGAEFVEVVLDAPPAVAMERFRDRRTELADRAARHPEADVAEGAVASAVVEASTMLQRVAASRPRVVHDHAAGDIETTYGVLLAVVGSDGSSRRPEV